jgi:hypothetical protein
MLSYFRLFIFLGCTLTWRLFIFLWSRIQINFLLDYFYSKEGYDECKSCKLQQDNYPLTILKSCIRHLLFVIIQKKMF